MNNCMDRCIYTQMDRQIKGTQTANKQTFSMASLEILGSSSMVRELRLVALENSTGVSSSLNATARSSNTLPLAVFEISATKEAHRTQF
jgi:hypothetical protein